MLAVILYVIGIGFLILAAFSVTAGRFQFGWAGLAIIAFVALLLPHML